MSKINQIRASYTRDTIVVYQAFNDVIADAALRVGRFVAPFSLTRMTWIKPSLLWLMVRSHWATRRGQERILQIQISRSGWDKALELGVLTYFEPRVHHSNRQWREDFGKALVHIQWDPERSLRGATLPVNSIQVGLSRHIIDQYVNEWIVGIDDMTDQIQKIRNLCLAGKSERARRFLPKERVYPIEDLVARKLDMRN